MSIESKPPTPGTHGEFRYFDFILNNATDEQRASFAAQIAGGERVMVAYRALAEQVWNGLDEAAIAAGLDQAGLTAAAFAAAGITEAPPGILQSIRNGPPPDALFEAVDRNWFGMNSNGTSMWLVHAIATPEEMHAVIAAATIEIVDRLNGPENPLQVRIAGQCEDPSFSVTITQVDSFLEVLIETPDNMAEGAKTAGAVDTSTVLPDLITATPRYSELTDDEKRQLLNEPTSDLTRLVERLEDSKPNNLAEELVYYDTVLARSSTGGELTYPAQGQPVKEQRKGGKTVIFWPRS